MPSRILYLCCLLLLPSLCEARVVRIEVETRQDVLAGQAFGLAGAYEKIAGKVFFAADPANSANRIITDIDLAPRNAQDEVEYSSEFYLLKPKEVSRGNGTLLYEVSNRGRKGMLGMFNFAAGNLDPSTADHFGDGLLLREGYTLLWVGWQWDPPPRPELLHVFPPVARENGKPVRGLVRSDFVVTDRIYDHSLADRDHVAYPVADPDAPENVLTVRDGVGAPRRVIPRANWKFAHSEGGHPAPNRSRVYLEGGFEPGKIYEVVYVAEDPVLVGLGPAAVRDMVSRLKHEGAAEVAITQDSIERAIGFGTSQSGRFLRTFLYYGFNEDEQHRRVFDGVMAHVAGGGRGSFNHRFAQASRDAHPYMNFLHPTDIFPFTDAEQTDPETGLTDGLTHRIKPEFRPKIFYTNSAYEYWGRAASLIHTTIDGKRDMPLPENVRIYFLTGSQHGPAAFPPGITLGQQPANPMEYRWPMRALLTAMNRWVTDDKTPPESRYPKVADGTLVPPEQLKFPAIPGVRTSTRPHKAYRANYGPQFYSKGIVTKEPPEIGTAFPILVPAVDQDGNELAGIRLPELVTPLATYTGWNLFNAKSGPVDEISSMVGSSILFPRSKTEREARKDPRLSIMERYGSREAYLGRVSEAAVKLAGEGYLLDADVAGLVRQADRRWKHWMESETQ